MNRMNSECHSAKSPETLSVLWEGFIKKLIEIFNFIYIKWKFLIKLFHTSHFFPPVISLVFDFLPDLGLELRENDAAMFYSPFPS